MSASESRKSIEQAVERELELLASVKGYGGGKSGSGRHGSSSKSHRSKIRSHRSGSSGKSHRSKSRSHRSGSGGKSHRSRSRSHSRGKSK